MSYNKQSTQKNSKVCSSTPSPVMEQSSKYPAIADYIRACHDTVTDIWGKLPIFDSVRSSITGNPHNSFDIEMAPCDGGVIGELQMLGERLKVLNMVLDEQAYSLSDRVGFVS